MSRHWLITALLISTLTRLATAQTSILNTQITLECRQQPLSRVLELISTSGGFYFSYSGTPFNKDSLVTLPAQTRSVRQLLDLLFHGRLQYLEDGRYLILLPAPKKTTQAFPADRRFVISGTILDQRTGRSLADVSIYDPTALSAAMSKKDGRFNIRVKNKGWPILLAVSKENYSDTLIQLQPGTDRELTVSLYPDAFPPKALLLSTHPRWNDDSIRIEYQNDSITTTGKKLIPGVEATGFGRLLLTSRLRMQSLNLNKIFIQRPIQLSLVPGLSTNGPLNSQVTNKFSLNLLGGYEAGITGAELGGVFNIDKKTVDGFQAAGVLNIVGDSVHGAQFAGILNKDMNAVHGFQAAGISNTAREVEGMQAAGICNSADKVEGVQASGLINRTRHLQGVQIGLINIADTSEGMSIGLINIVRHGLHELSYYADELSPLNFAFRSGTPGIYGIFYAGTDPNQQRRSYYYGYGFGHRFPVSHGLGIRSEVTYAALSPLNLRHFDSKNSILRLNLDAHWQPVKGFAVSFGPSFNVYFPGKNEYNGSEPFQLLPHGYRTYQIGKASTICWIGWRAAVSLF